MNYQFKKSNGTGFTLIELMVVIAIIGLLSSVVLASLARARLKGRDSKIIQEVNQLRTLLELEHSESASYANLQPQTWFPSSACNSVFSGTYTLKTREICASIVANSSDDFAGPNNRLFMGINSTAGTTATKYSVMAYLPGAAVFYCVGSSGKNSKTTTSAVYTASGFLQPGCYSNP
ncbi:MAG: type II secretion system GspH family protein [bacterium]|nr:type II secretion system GspH family protein [bacterium]